MTNQTGKGTDMDYQNLMVEVGEDFVGCITLDAPERLNTFTSAMAAELLAALEQMDADSAVRVVLLSGAGKAFCAGIDVNEMEGQSPNQLKHWVERMERPLGYMDRMQKPVITAVRGVAAANGAGLVAASDLCICGKSARIGFTAVKVGLFCLGPAVPLLRVVGRKVANELLFYGRLIKPERAMDLGLVNRVVDDDALEGQARAWAAELARLSPTAVQLSKQALACAAEVGYHQAFDFMNEAFARLCTTGDAKEGVQAFLEKRDPVWRGQ